MGKIVENQINSIPEFPPIDYESTPKLTADDYQKRIQSVLKLASSHDYTHLVIYGDREHYSNIQFFTGFDPRFEEALLILSQEYPPTLVVGNEGLGYAAIIPLNLKKELFQSFSLVGQPRGQGKSLNEIFRSAGIHKNSSVGVIGWKYYKNDDFDDPDHIFEIPCYIIHELNDLIGWERLHNACDLTIHPDYGLRICLDLKELVLHEISGTKTSQRVLQTLQSLKPGESEIETSRYLAIDGDPLSVHPNVNFGPENVLLGLGSPTYQKKLKLGEVITVGLGYRRALCARTGLYVRRKDEIPPEMKGIVENLYIPYYRALCDWYEAIHIGASGGEIFKTIKESIGDFEKFGIGLNPGHFIHTEEWTNSIFFERSPYQIKSGMAIQCDIIAFPGKPFVGVHVEDGIVIADEKIRADIQTQYPQSWKRIALRRKYMKDVLGINLSEDVLPVSNIQATLFPYMGNQKIVLSK